MKVIVIGAGGTTRELLRRLGERWDVTLVDVDEGRLRLAEGIRAFEALVGDGSSALVLKRAGIEQADAVVAATHDDDVNLEAIRLAREAGVIRVVGVAADPERLAHYREYEVPVYSPDSLSARNVEVQLEPRRVASTAFADGKAEAIEFIVSPDSPVRGKALREIHSETWIIAAVLREGNLIVPHGYTRLEAGDRVTVVGSATDFASIVRTFTSGESRFPLNYGKSVLVGLSGPEDLEGKVAEAISLVRNTLAEQLIITHRDPTTLRDEALAEQLEAALEELETSVEGVQLVFRPYQESLEEAIENLCEGENIGVIVVDPPDGNELTGRLRAAALLNEYGRHGRPVLLAGGGHPYTGIVVPARRTAAGEAAARAAIDLASSVGAVVTGIAVIEPAFVGGTGTDEARRAAAWVREEAAVQDVTVRRKIRRGNPVRVLAELAAGASLLVVGMPEGPARAFRPSIAGHLVHRVRSSVLLVPPRV